MGKRVSTPKYPPAAPRTCQWPVSTVNDNSLSPPCGPLSCARGRRPSRRALLAVRNAAYPHAVEVQAEVGYNSGKEFFENCGGDVYRQLGVLVRRSLCLMHNAVTLDFNYLELFP